MEIKVLCNCGVKYKFDAEPVNGQMPYVVNCPSCGADGTDFANSFIQESLQPAAASANVAVAQPRIRLNVPVHSAPTAPSAPLAPIYSAPATETYSLRQESPKEKSILLGIIGAVLAGFVGMMAWYYLIKWTGYEIGYAAWGVGFLTGVGARVVGCKGTAALGIFAGICALVAIIGGQYLAVKAEADKYFEESARESYDKQMAFAKQALEAKSDAELKALLAQEMTDFGEKKQTTEISDKKLKEFKENELPLLKAFVNGGVTRKQFEDSLPGVKNSVAYHFMLLKESIGLFTLLWLFLGVGSAFKIASGASGD